MVKLCTKPLHDGPYTNIQYTQKKDAYTQNIQIYTTRTSQIKKHMYKKYKYIK